MQNIIPIYFSLYSDVKKLKNSKVPSFFFFFFFQRQQKENSSAFFSRIVENIFWIMFSNNFAAMLLEINGLKVIHFVL